MGKKEKLDKFFTNDNIVSQCLLNIDLSSYHTIIDPCAGNGAFSDKIPYCLAFDILPDKNGIEQKDFFALDYTGFQRPVLCISNPPFGVQNNLAVRFFNKAAEFADTIAFILPKSFKKTSVQEKLNPYFHLVFEEDLPAFSFNLFQNGVQVPYDVPTVFQIWDRRGIERIPPKKEEPKGFEFVNRELANIAVRRVGFYAGKAFVEVLNKSEQSHYFIRAERPEKFVEIANAIIWPYENTVGPRSISKQELVQALNKFGV